jgi:hydroxymethylbilane synthase
LGGAPFLRLGSRGSPLALFQAEETRSRLAQAFGIAPQAIALTIIKTSGDKVLDKPLYDIGGKGLFTKEIEEALLANEIDVAVHSLKDVPSICEPALEIAAVLEREDPRDGLITIDRLGLSELKPGARIGTSSPRRRAQLRRLRPDLELVDLRGNVDTRLAKLSDGRVDATLLGMAGLNRLKRALDVVLPLEPEIFLPAAAQGAIGLQIRTDDHKTREILSRINHAPSYAATTAERAMLGVLDGSCRTPIAAFGQIQEGRLHLRGLVCDPNGERMIDGDISGDAKDSLRMGLDLGARLKRDAPSGMLS